MNCWHCGTELIWGADYDMEDVARLNDRIGKLRTHFGQAEKDIELIETSGRKIGARGERITGVELEEAQLEDGQTTELNLPDPLDG